MRTMTKIAAGLGAAAALSVSFAGVATADRGDGQLACNSGEICFSEHSYGNGGQRHFWNGAEHSGAGNFTNPNGSTGVRFYHNASAVKNRDTACGVWVEESGDWTNDKQYFGRWNGWANINSDINDENARHWRC
ncbi:hypothetical protein [Nocardioides speluncae]|uniref:hypothetical protein n=1 Tax=Nocardioides speluncae TaxID=2670337 RepID=UPI000D69212E|nr:hypothetical protein [Nocardioides speluncae]